MAPFLLFGEEMKIAKKLVIASCGFTGIQSPNLFKET